MSIARAADVSAPARVETTCCGGGPARARAEATSLRVTSPPDGAVYLIDPTLRRGFQTLPLRAAADDRGAIEWRVDGVSVGAAKGPIDWPLAPGRHVITARDTRGREAAATITVR